MTLELGSNGVLAMESFFECTLTTLLTVVNRHNNVTSQRSQRVHLLDDAAAASVRGAAALGVASGA